MPVLPRQDDSAQGAVPTEAPPTDTNTEPTGAPNPENNIYGGHNGLSSAQIGGIVGALVGFTVLVLLILYCAINRRREQRRRRHRRRYQQQRYVSSSSSSSEDSSYLDYTSSSASSSVPPVKPLPKAKTKHHSHHSHSHRHQPGKKKVRIVEKTPRGPRERIPGGEKFPAYRAIPVPNPREPHPKLRYQV